MTRLPLPDGVCLNVEVTGAGRPLVLLHGFTGSAANWRDLIDELSGRYAVVAIDLLGHGQSDSPPDPARYRMERCIEDVPAVFDALGVVKPVLLGYSMGGRVALSLAATRPECLGALILESASPGLSASSERVERAARDAALADLIEKEGLDWFVAYWEKMPLFASQANLPEGVRAELRQGRLRNNPVGLANSLRGMGTGVQPENWDRLSAMTLPTLILSGVLDHKFTAIGQQMADRIPGALITIVPDAGHSIHLEQPAVYARLVVDFIERELI